jgi:proteasome lid subunit RPN8/RPN11
MECVAERLRIIMLKCPSSCIESTLECLLDAGAREQECVVLWLGKRNASAFDVLRCYRPIQIAKADQFYIPPEGMTALQTEMRSERLMVAAQVHSHPGRAFHSQADDAWAIVRHEGALSLVVPRFASDTTIENFLIQTKVFQFSSRATWDEVPQFQVTKTCLQVI